LGINLRLLLGIKKSTVRLALLFVGLLGLLQSAKLPIPLALLLSESAGFRLLHWVYLMRYLFYVHPRVSDAKARRVLHCPGDTQVLSNWQKSFVWKKTSGSSLQPCTRFSRWQTVPFPNLLCSETATDSDPPPQEPHVQILESPCLRGTDWAERGHQTVRRRPVNLLCFL